MNDLVPRPGPLGRMLATAERLAGAAEGPAFRRDLLYGERSLRRPLSVIATKKELGNCRHALSQMVVAGVMTVYPPMRPGGVDKPAPQLEPRVLTFTPPPPRDAEPAAAAAPRTSSAQASLPTRPPPRSAMVTSTAPSRATAPAPAGRPGATTARTASGGGPVVTIERKTVENFTPMPSEDE